MAYQKLQAGKAWSVYPSNNTNIPDISVVGPTGNTDGVDAGGLLLIDSTRTGTNPSTPATLSFTLSGLKPGMIIVNSTTGKQSELVTVVNGTTLKVKDAIFAAQPAAYSIYGGTQGGAVLYIGTAGSVRVTTVAGDDVTFVGINTGAFFPVQVTKVWETGGTTASNIIALW
tara:strand:+ start:1495 stop:2007 length:513 start_codon:yes stop_codon:yes gene_type:complete